MAAATVLYRDSPSPGVEVVRLRIAADADTYVTNLSRAEVLVMGAPERDNAAADSWGYTIDAARKTITLQAVATTSFDVCFVLYGTP